MNEGFTKVRTHYVDRGPQILRHRLQPGAWTRLQELGCKCQMASRSAKGIALCLSLTDVYVQGGKDVWVA